MRSYYRRAQSKLFNETTHLVRRGEALEARLEAIADREDYGQWIHCFGDDTTPETAERQALLAEVKALIVRRGEIGMKLYRTE